MEIAKLDVSAKSVVDSGVSPRLQRAARDFEALVLHSILKEAMPEEGDATLAQFGAEALANAIAAQGGLGLCQFLTDHVQDQPQTPAAEGTASTT